MNTILEKVRLALRITTNDFDSELTDLINACLKDLSIAGITQNDTTNELLIRAICTYCKMHFGDNMSDYEKLKSSYDEQKAQMQMSTGYTDWNVQE